LVYNRAMLSLERQNTLRQQYRQAHPEWRPGTELFAALVRQHLRPDSRLLDLGCGRGGLVEQLDHPLPNTVGIDPDWLSLREHRLAIPRACALSHRLPLKDDCLDLVFASWVLEHLERPADDLREIARVLQPGGVFVFITPNKRHPLVGLNRLAGRFSSLQDWLVSRLYDRPPADTFPVYYRANDTADLTRLAQDSGLTLGHLQPVPDPTYLAFTPGLFRLAAALEGRLSPGRHIHLVGWLFRTG
jgi:SAM-dependent methyltransferase